MNDDNGKRNNLLLHVYAYAVAFASMVYVVFNSFRAFDGRDESILAVTLASAVWLAHILLVHRPTVSSVTRARAALDRSARAALRVTAFLIGLGVPLVLLTLAVFYLDGNKTVEGLISIGAGVLWTAIGILYLANYGAPKTQVR